MAKLGFIGLGVMGGNMVARLLEKGHTVTGYNRTRSKAQWLIDKGMKFAGSPAKVREKGADMIDAPVSGSVITLQQGKLSVMVGGPKETFEHLKPLLLDIGPKVTHVGDNGVALSMKIAVNLQLAVQMLGFCEGVLLAERSGIPREVAVDVMIHSAIASPMIVYRGPFVLQQPEEAGFDVNMMQKDMLLAMELGRKLNVPLPTTAISNEFLTAARGMGWEKLDFAVMFDVLARMSGVQK